MKIGLILSAFVLSWTVSAAWGQVEDLRTSFENQKEERFSQTRSIETWPLHRGLALITNTSSATEEVEFRPVSRENQVNVRIGFEFDSAVIREDQLALMDPLCEVMNEMSDTSFRVIGHTDSTGEESYNDRLSLQRALAVQSHLGECGVANDRLKAVGVGERYPFVETAERSAENRRVEFQVIVE